MQRHTISVIKSVAIFIALNFFPAIFLYAGQSEYVTEGMASMRWINWKDVEEWKFYFFLIGSFLAIFVNGILYYKEATLRSKVKNYTEVNRKIVNKIIEELCTDLKISRSDLHLRAFKVKTNIFSDYQKLCNFHIDEITDDLEWKEKLVFKYSKKKNHIEGVVGLCLELEDFAYDYNGIHRAKYSLSRKHENMVGDVTFCCAGIIYNREKIKYVISLDSIKIKIDGNLMSKSQVEQIMSKHLKSLCKAFDKYIL